MNLIQSRELINIFTLLNKQKLNYILMRNINDEIPSTLEIGKDIDILVKDRSKMADFFKKNQFNKINHPYDDDIFLYGAEKFEFYKNNEGTLFDLNFQITVRSLDEGQWIPLDQTIQESAWKNKRFEQISDDFGYWALSYDDEFICLVARSIFDKKNFQSGYQKRINELFLMINKDEMIRKLNMIFFKFTPYLMDMIERQDYDKVIINYLQFKEY